MLEATGDLKRARGLKERDPQLLLVKAALLLPPLGSVPIEPDASDEEVRLALRKIREKIEPRSSERSYAVSLRRVHAKLIDGVTAKGRRAPNLPLEVIDPAEFVCLELDDLNAVDPRTGEKIFYDLLVCAQELIDGKSEASFGSEFSSAPREPDIGDQKLAQVSQAMIGGTAEIGSSTKPAPPLSDRDLRSWYEERVAELTAGGEACSGPIGRRRSSNFQGGSQEADYGRCGTNSRPRTGRNKASEHLRRSNKNPPEIGRRKKTAADMPNFTFGARRNKSVRVEQLVLQVLGLFKWKATLPQISPQPFHLACLSLIARSTI